jgi:DNA-binding NtrC family response regulator
MQSMGGMRQLRRQIALFLEDIYAPRCLALYFPTRGEGESSRELAQDAGLARIADAESIPPQRLSPTLLAFLRQYRLESGEEGGLAADLIAQAERYGDPLAVERLTALAACGVEIILPLYGEDRRTAPGSGGASDAVATAADAEWPEAVIVLGLLSEGRPLDHGDLLWLRLLRTPALLALKNQELLGAMTELTERLEEENKRITSRLERDLQGFSQAGSAAAFVFKPGGRLAQVIAQAERFADMDAPVLITGETGSGKGAIARLIHGVSRRQGKFLTVNCSAIPRDLIENELFGHEKGAYTGAVEASEGLVARAAGGTLFFDEIGELPLEGQTKLLRLVQEGAFERIGSNETLQSTARFLFATNRNLEVEAQEGRFRLDLFFRISALEIHAPPLRERREDIPLLVDHFLWNAGRNMGREGLRFTPAALELLLRHNWPGNVRELENLILRAVALSEANLLDVDQLPVMFRDDMDFDRKRTHLERIGVERERLERELLLEAMRRSEGNQREAARLLNISRGSLQYRLRQYGLV